MKNVIGRHVRPASQFDSGHVKKILKVNAIYFATLVIGILVFAATPKRSVSSNYEQAAVHWIEGAPLYAESKENGHGFLYLPQAAILHIPFSILSNISGLPWFGDVCWRITSWLMLVFGCWHFRKLSIGSLETNWIMASCVSLLGISCLRIGQSTLLLTALMILALVAWRWQRFTQATICIALAVAVKPLAIVLALLMFAISSPMRVRLLLASIALALFPFACQAPGYVIQQYRECWTMLHTAADLGNSGEWAQLFGMLDSFGFHTSGRLENMVRVVAAFATLVLAFRTLSLSSVEKQAIWLFTWTVVYLLLFSPRTENSTYCLLGPVLGVIIADSFVRDGRSMQTIMLTVLTVLIAGSYEIGKYFTSLGDKAIWLAPMACCILLVYLLFLFTWDSLFSRENRDKQLIQDRKLSIG